MSKIQEAVDTINQSFNEAAAKQDGGSFNKLSMMLSEFDAGLREYIQEATKNDILKIIEKMHSNHDLSSQDLSFIRTWIIGDAESYANEENNVEDWNAELKKLVQRINEFKNTDLSVSGASSLRALLLDAMRTAGNIAFFLQQKERVAKFTSSVGELDGDERLLLTQILVSKLKSDEY